MAFYVGQKVCCVDAREIEKPGSVFFSHATKKLVCIEGGLDGLTEGAIYTVRAFGTAHNGALGLHLAEIERPRYIPYRATRFRPVVEPKTDISIFKAMLNPKIAEIDA